jgi:ribonuclease P protein component
MRKTDEFSSVFRFRCARSSNGLEVLAAPNGLNYPRLGLIVPKKIIATAVGRNRIKRLVRESFRLHQTQFTGLDVVARIRSKIDDNIIQNTFSTMLRECSNCVTLRSRHAIHSDNSLKL